MRTLFNVDLMPMCCCRRRKLPSRWDPKFGSRTLTWPGSMGRSSKSVETPLRSSVPMKRRYVVFGNFWVKSRFVKDKNC